MSTIKRWLGLIVAAFRWPSLPDYPPEYGMCPKCFKYTTIEKFKQTLKSAQRSRQ